MPKPSSFLIEDAIVVTMDPRRRVIEGGSILVEGERIAEIVGPEFKPNGRAQKRISAKGMVAIPGLIDTHVHLAQSLLRGCADDLSLVAWLRERVWPIQGSFTEDDGRVSAELSMLEMVKSGTTSFVRMPKSDSQSAWSCSSGSDWELSFPIAQPFVPS